MATLKLRNPDGTFTAVTSPEVAPHGNDVHEVNYATEAALALKADASALTTKADLVDGIVPVQQLPPQLENVIDILYTDLVSAMSASGLSQGQYYRITDYQTKRFNSTFPFTGILVLHEGPVEPLIVLANSTSTIHAQAYSEQFPYDIIHYTTFKPIENDSDSYGGNPDHRGTIVYRKDTIRNLSTHYDFRNVYNRRWNTIANPTRWDQITDVDSTTDFVDYLTFDLTPVNNSLRHYNINIGPYFVLSAPLDGIPAPFPWPSNIVIMADSNSIHCDGLIGATFGQSCIAINVKGPTDNLTFGDGCSDISIASSCSSITFGAACAKISIDAQSSGITFGESVTHTSIGRACNSITIGPSVSNMSIGDISSSIEIVGSNQLIKIGNSCSSITLGLGTSSVSVDENSGTINIGENCSNISFGRNNGNHIFGDFVIGVSIGTNSSAVTIGSNSGICTIKNYCTSISISGTCEGIYIGEYSSSITVGESCANLIFRDLESGITYPAGTVNINRRDLSYYDVIVNTTPTSAGNFIYDVNDNITSYDEIKNGTIYTVSFTYSGTNKVLTETKYGKVITYEYDLSDKLIGFSIADAP